MESKIINSDRKKYLRQIGHHLKPIVTISSNGLSESVLQEIDRALNDHELIKVKLSTERKTEILEELSEKTNCSIVQKIGHIVLIIRESKKPNPKLSNLLKN
jgi:RNA-binding protein